LGLLSLLLCALERIAPVGLLWLLCALERVGYFPCFALFATFYAFFRFLLLCLAFYYFYYLLKCQKGLFSLLLWAAKICLQIYAGFFYSQIISILFFCPYLLQKSPKAFYSCNLLKRFFLNFHFLLKLAKKRGFFIGKVGTDSARWLDIGTRWGYLCCSALWCGNYWNGLDIRNKMF